ncbi:hypothetical protein [Nitrosopumilus sp.]|uniref:hypothetical protein n=1 Tax=Nitrosopumilus sp. TaxID=2024843 RepID=UPI00247E5035|nr:hypothetical protein [Nitrosopumilus sp.]MCV0410700.1 hypothetical protein [Nitrosopumilus sp.]
MVYADPPHLLSSFQRWALIYLHDKEESRSAMQILKDCCITAMDERFGKKDVTEGLYNLTKMELIKVVPKNLNDIIGAGSKPEGELSEKFNITADGIIYTKKMLKPILSLIDNGNIEKIAQKLDPKTDSWIKRLIDNAKNLSQQEIVQEIAKYGLGNIDGLSNLLEGLRNIKF